MLDIYESADPSSAFTVSGNFGNPFTAAFDGVLGEVIERKVYVRNDDALYYYENITVQPIDGGDDIVDGSGVTEDYNWKLYAGDSQPLEEQWELTSAGNQIALADLGSSGNPDTTTYLPFWVRISVPTGAPVNAYNSVLLRLSFDEQGA